MEYYDNEDYFINQEKEQFIFNPEREIEIETQCKNETLELDFD